MSAIALINPKHVDNVAKILRLCSCYGIPDLYWSGQRVNLDEHMGRLPREERMKGYRDVQFHHDERFFDATEELTPVAIEVRETSQNLLDFEHPKNPLYVFGPEDGGIKKPHVNHCHHFVQIPVRHCLNLATAVATVLWDRQYKMWMNDELESPPRS